MVHLETMYETVESVWVRDRVSQLAFSAIPSGLSRLPFPLWLSAYSVIKLILFSILPLWRAFLG